ncbi:MAG TPA: response regulator [Myxococcota bacterium]|nr:response regulator [Myxococcota bacterium]
MRILLVDDEPLVLRSYARLLRASGGCEVVCASGGAEALAQLEGERAFDLMLCDLAMPAIDGIAVHRSVCESHPELAGRFAFLTGGVLDAASDRYLAESGAMVLVKPVRQEELEKLIARAAPRSIE